MSAPHVTECDVEPIHTPGSIQPHGVLLALDSQSNEVLQVSANAKDVFGVSAEAVLAQSIDVLFSASIDALRAGLSRARSIVGEPFDVIVNGRTFDARAHRYQGVAILELERPRVAPQSSDLALRRALTRLQGSNTVRELYRIAVDAIRALTGFDRVMLYRFDDDGHGDVLEEARAEGVDSYLGHRFPGSDIPRQARELYLLNWLRLIPDASYRQVLLVPEQRRDTGTALDLSFATLRSVSPVHLEYLRNMRVGASMSVSLVLSESLWGLIACHHRTARHVSFAARAACEVVGRTVSLQLAAQLELESRASRDALHGFETQLVQVMRDAPGGVASALLQRTDILLRLVGASGAAVYTGSSLQTVGATPAPEQITVLVDWLAKESLSRVLHTDALASRHAPAADYARVASGLLAMALPGTPTTYVLWFRPEVIRTVTWAGNPAKAVHKAEGQGLHPRHSFEAWKEVVRGRARPWSAVEVDAAHNLRRSAIEADLAKQIARAEQAIALREEVVAVLSHDLKSPLQVIDMALEALEPGLADHARGTQMVERIRRAVDRMNGLIRDLLDLAKIEAGRFQVNQSPLAVEVMVSEAIAMLTPLAEAKQVRLGWTGCDSWVAADADRVFQVLSNLVGNAIKFTPPGGTVTLEAYLEDGFARFAVRDTGPGVPPGELAHIFDRYWQARRVRSAGAGLGLYIAKGLIEAHGGRLWAESTLGTGATFFFTLPLSSPDSPRRFPTDS